MSQAAREYIMYSLAANVLSRGLRQVLELALMSVSAGKLEFKDN